MTILRRRRRVRRLVPAAAVALLPVLTAVCAADRSAVTATGAAAAALPFPPEADPWPAIRHERIRTLLPDAMRRAGIDAWVVICRENHNDPLADHVGGENAGGAAAFLFFLAGDGVRLMALSPQGEATALAEVGPQDTLVVMQRGADVYAHIAAELRARDPSAIGINTSTRAIADGLSHTQHTALARALGPLADRLVSAEEVVIEWLGVKLPAEVEILRRAAALTEQLQLEAYAMVVPGETTDADVARFLKRRMAELGVEDAWAPDQNPNVNSGPDRGHSHATDRVIRPGDFIQTDFGIRVWGRWVTDIQRFAYVLAPGETEPPAEALARWELARTGGRVAFEAMRPGATGWDVDAAQRRHLAAVGSIPIMWSTGHPVGYWAHDVGPRLGGAADGAAPAGDAARTLRPGQVFAFDGFFGWPLGDGTTKTISVEEMAVITATGAEYLIPPQQALVLIPSR
jgi:Xaa-Pro dipeptidase